MVSRWKSSDAGLGCSKPPFRGKQRGFEGIEWAAGFLLIFILSSSLLCCLQRRRRRRTFPEGANPNFEYEFGVTPLMNAALRGSLRSAVLLRVLQSNWKEMPELHAGHVSMRFPAP
jgi:hypothetical protein